MTQIRNGATSGVRSMGLLACAAALLALVATAHAGDGTFTSTVTPVGDDPRSVAVADLDNDGNQDVVTANEASRSVSVLLGDGAGGFTGAAATTTLSIGPGNAPFAIAVGDVDNDGNQDLVTANSGSSTVWLLRGNGAGGFAAASLVNAVPSFSVALADLDNDGDQDLVLANFGGDSVAVLRGNGAGGFSAPSSRLVGDGPRSVAIADLNNDGLLDVATANQNANTVSVLTGNGAGGFAAAAFSTAVGAATQSVAVADLNTDGNEDLVTADIGSGTLSVLLANGSGGFVVPARAVAIADAPYAVAVADVNNDGRQDLVTPRYFASAASVLLGDGVGGLGPAASTPVAAPQSVAVADLDNDGNQDLLAANRDADSVSVLLGNGPSPGAGNLLVNPGAEGPGAATTAAATPVFPGWTRTAGTPTFVRYATPGFPSLIDAGRWAGGSGFFSGGTDPSASAEQTVALAGQAPSIDAGLASATLSGLIGGFRNQADAASLTATFLGAAAQPIGTPITIGPISAADRKNLTILLRRSASARIPAGTRSIRVAMTMTRVGGTSNDGYLDDLSLRVSAPVPVVITGPGPVPLARPLCKGKRATIIATMRITRGTKKADVIVGRAGPDVVRALGGDDIVCGRGGADLIDGGPGDDTLLGQAGLDRLIGGAGRDRLLGGVGRDLLRGGLGLDRLVGGPGLDRQLQ